MLSYFGQSYEISLEYLYIVSLKKNKKSPKISDKYTAIDRKKRNFAPYY